MSDKARKITKENQFEIDNGISNDLLCSICSELMIKACNAPCGCHFCSDCIENYLDGNDKFCPGTAKYCRKKMINYSNDVSIDTSTNNRISEIVVKYLKNNALLRAECKLNQLGFEGNNFPNNEIPNGQRENLIETIKDLRKKIESMKKEIIEIKTSYQNQREENIQVEKMRKTIDKLCSQHADFELRLNEHDVILKQINDLPKSNIVIRQTENEKGFSELEWKIPNVSQQAKAKHIYSNPFYSDKYGYKMCLSVYFLKIDNVIGVYFHLLRGEFDDSLEWPFKCVVTIELINQKNGKSLEIKTKKYSDCPLHEGWVKPTNEKNDGIWFYDIRGQILSAAVRNNQLIYKCKVTVDKSKEI